MGQSISHSKAFTQSWIHAAVFVIYNNICRLYFFHQMPGGSGCSCLTSRQQESIQCILRQFHTPVWITDVFCWVWNLHRFLLLYDGVIGVFYEALPPEHKFAMTLMLHVKRRWPWWASGTHDWSRGISCAACIWQARPPRLTPCFSPAATTTSSSGGRVRKRSLVSRKCWWTQRVLIGLLCMFVR